MSSFLASLAETNIATRVQMMHAMFSAGAHGAARSAWIEINRPLTSLGINATLASQSAGKAFADTLVLPTVNLPIGMDIKSITCIASDVDAGWQAVNLAFGTLQLVNPQGGPINLSMFDPRLEHQDRLAPWILSKTKVDVQVVSSVQNGAFFSPGFTPGVAGQVAVFHGFALNAFQEEQVCAIQTRIEPTDRNVGNAELILHMRQTIGVTLGLNIPAHMQAPSQIGRVGISAVAMNPMAMHLAPALAPGGMAYPQPVQRYG